MATSCWDMTFHYYDMGKVMHFQELCLLEFNGFVIKFQGPQFFSIKSCYVDLLMREAIDLELHPNNMNREGGMTLSGS
jgi:hypothetical protein